MNIHEFNAILKENKLDLVQGPEIVNSFNHQSGDNQGLKMYGEVVEIGPVVIPQHDALHEVDNDQSKVSSFHHKSTFEDNKPLSTSIEPKNDFDTTKNSEKSRETLTSVSHHQISNEVVPPNFGFVFDSPVSSSVSMNTTSQSVSVLDNYLDIPRSSPPNRRKKFRKWWQQKKEAFVGLFRACCSCRKTNSARDVLRDCK